MTDALKRTPGNPYMWDPTSGEAISMLDPNGNYNVAVADQTTRPLDLYFLQKEVSTTLAVAVTAGDKQVTLTNAVGIAVGDFLTFIEDIQYPIRATQAQVTSISGAPTLTVDRPLDQGFAIGDKVVSGTNAMNVDGSVTPQSFTIRGFDIEPPLQFTFDITRIMIQMTTTDPPEFGDFGDIASGITNGVLLRRMNGDYENFWCVKKNSEFAILAYDLTIYNASLPIGINGLSMRFTFAGQEKHGVAVRLAPGENLELLIQDNLTSLLSFHAMAQGHVVN